MLLVLLVLLVLPLLLLVLLLLLLLLVLLTKISFWHVRMTAANAAHWFDDIKQVIFEHNTIRPGGAEMSWGNNIDNYSGGYCQHVYHAHNHFQNVWAGDREVMTFDPVMGDYFGGATCTGTTCTLSTTGDGSANKGSMGGMVSVLAGNLRMRS